MLKNLFNISDLSKEEIITLLNLKVNNKVLNSKCLGMIFEKHSTRTRLSFSVGISKLGGNFIDIKFSELNISRDESFEDTFRALDCYLDGLVYRTSDHQKLLNASKYFNKPIINALSDVSHPCQILSDLYTIQEKFGSLKCHILWMGDMNNVCFSLVEAANLIEELKLTICTSRYISSKIKWITNSNINIIHNLNEVNLSSVNCVMTDVFISMNDQDNKEKKEILSAYSVNTELMLKTDNNSIFMHCLPAKVGTEVSEDVICGPKSIVWRQAYNRMVVQKKLLQFIYQ